jgi:hypothetical protein
MRSPCAVTSNISSSGGSLADLYPSAGIFLLCHMVLREASQLAASLDLHIAPGFQVMLRLLSGISGCHQPGCAGSRAC